MEGPAQGSVAINHVNKRLKFELKKHYDENKETVTCVDWNAKGERCKNPMESSSKKKAWVRQAFTTLESRCPEIEPEVCAQELRQLALYIFCRHHRQKVIDLAKEWSAILPREKLTSLSLSSPLPASSPATASTTDIAQHSLNLSQDVFVADKADTASASSPGQNESHCWAGNKSSNEEEINEMDNKQEMDSVQDKDKDRETMQDTASSTLNEAEAAAAPVSNAPATPSQPSSLKISWSPFPQDLLQRLSQKFSPSSSPLKNHWEDSPQSSQLPPGSRPSNPPSRSPSPTPINLREKRSGKVSRATRASLGGLKQGFDIITRNGLRKPLKQARRGVSLGLTRVNGKGTIK